MSLSFSAVSGFFTQDEHLVDPIFLGPLPLGFGLLDTRESRWAEFRAKIDQLNANAPEGTSFKVFFLGRHGQGFHNVAESKFGTKAWDEHWSKLNGEGDLVWGPDPLLTPYGESQALEARAAWETEISAGIPTPQKFYSSPHKRALDTWTLTFAGEQGSILGANENPAVLILENCREEYGEHTCDLRSSLSSLRSIYPAPTYTFEEGFAENDPLWKPDERETKAHIASRAIAVLNRIFSEPDTYISITSHGGFINGFLSAIGRSYYALPTGGVIPVVVKGTIVSNAVEHNTSPAPPPSEY